MKLASTSYRVSYSSFIKLVVNITNFVCASSQGQHTHSARTESQISLDLGENWVLRFSPSFPEFLQFWVKLGCDLIIFYIFTIISASMQIIDIFIKSYDIVLCL